MVRQGLLMGCAMFGFFGRVDRHMEFTRSRAVGEGVGFGKGGVSRIVTRKVGISKASSFYFD
jgi:hypothetical protein